MGNKGIFASVIVLCMFAATAFGDVIANVDKNNVVYGETLNFTLKTDELSGSNTPNFSDLKKEFYILSTGQAHSVSIINGVKTSSNEWHLILKPKNKGKLIIPNIKVGTSSSQPINVIVEEHSAIKQSKVKGKKQKDVFVRMVVDKRNPLVQEQIILTVKIYYTTNLIRGNLSEPKVSDTIIVPFEKENKYREEKNGNNYTVIERKYALSPQKSGKLTIEGPTFEGIFADDVSSSWSTNQFDNFFQIDEQQPVIITADPIVITVQGSIKEENLKYWLPARKVILQENWNIPATIKVGQPINRTILLTAEGLSGEQLPDLIAHNVKGFNHYHDKPKFNNTISQNTIVGERKDLITYIPIEAGSMILPAIHLKWWNKVTKQFEVATLPEKKIEVLPGGQIKKHNTDEEGETKVEKTSSLPQKQDKNNIWVLATVVLIFLWVGTIVGFLLGKNKIKTITQKFFNFKIIPNNATTQVQSYKKSFKAIKEGCKNNDIALTKKYLLQWGQLYFKENIITLYHLASKFKEPLASELKDLDQIIYRNSSNQWHGERLLSYLHNMKSMIKPNHKYVSKDRLPPLNLE